MLYDMVEVYKDDPFAKFVIFSRYHESLGALKTMLESMTKHNIESEQNASKGKGKMDDAMNPFAKFRFKCAVIDGKGPAADKQENLRQFTEEPDCNVCLLSMGTAAAGLTLTVG